MPPLSNTRPPLNICNLEQDDGFQTPEYLRYCFKENLGQKERHIHPSFRGHFISVDEVMMEGCWFLVKSNRWTTVNYCTPTHDDWTWPAGVRCVPRLDGNVYGHFLLCGQWAGAAAGHLDCWSELWSDVQIYPNLHTHTHRTLLKHSKALKYI